MTALQIIGLVTYSLSLWSIGYAFGWMDAERFMKKFPCEKRGNIVEQQLPAKET